MSSMPHDNDRNRRNWQKFRAEMPITRRWAYFDHAAVSPLSGPAQQTLESWSREAATEGVVPWTSWTQRVEQVRQLAAGLINAEPREIALVPNTSSGIGLVAESYPWKSGDNVVTVDNEFPSNLYPWMNLESIGVETRRVKPDGVRIDTERLADACDERTKIVSVSWVGYATGYRVDVKQIAEIAHRHGALLFLDAIQGLGVFPIDVRDVGVDFLAADGHKWLLGPEGAGFFFIRSELLDLLRPTRVGWNSVVQRFNYQEIDLNLRPDAARYEAGSANLAGFLALGASLEMLVSFGLSATISPIAEQIFSIGETVSQHLEQLGAQIVSDRREIVRSGIIAFTLPNREPAKLKRVCLEHNVVVSCRGGYLRVSPHAYNNEEDIQRLVDALRKA